MPARRLQCRIVLDDIVRLGWHMHALEGWVAAVRLAAGTSASGGSPYCLAVAAGVTGVNAPLQQCMHCRSGKVGFMQAW